MINLIAMGSAAKDASHQMSLSQTNDKNDALETIAKFMEQKSEEILASNHLDVKNGINNGLSKALIDRLTITPESLLNMITDIRHIATLPDPIGVCFDKRVLENGLQIERQRVPIGVLGVIYESRPNVTVDVTSLAIKTGNAVILRGGSETINSNKVLVHIICDALSHTNLPKNCVQFVNSTDRKYVTEMLKLDKHIDMIIPRGTNKLHEYCRETSTIPVITGGIGICHLFVDEHADLDASIPVISNSKTQRPSVCNALDTLLVHKSIATKFLPEIVRNLQEYGVTFKVDEKSFSILEDVRIDSITKCVSLAKPHEFDVEWLSLVLGIKIVDSLEEAIDHIHRHSTNHSDGILTENKANANKFVQAIDSAAVYVNSSTRFTDGGQLGLGAEVAVSTQKIHARGPMGLSELSSYKWVIKGSYTSRE